MTRSFPQVSFNIQMESKDSEIMELKNQLACVTEELAVATAAATCQDMSGKRSSSHKVAYSLKHDVS